jgi:hypothetical protein
MSEKKPNLITIDDVEHDFDAMTQEQQLLVNHCVDLDRKIANTTFQLDQLKVGKEAFVNMLKNALAAPKPETVDAVETVQ